MNELHVEVRQTPGSVTWNFEDLKVSLRESLAEYKGMVYTDESIKAAKADVAMLRKLRKAVDAKRKEVKEKCLEPYNVIEKQAKELCGIIDEPINLIDAQVKDYENRQKAAAKAAIMEYMAGAFKGLPESIAKRAQFKIYDSRWENATTSKKVWQDAINSCREEIDRSIGILNGVEDEFKQEAFGVYSRDLDLSAAIQKVQYLQEQKKRILEAERQRLEQVERLRKEAAAEQERRDMMRAVQNAADEATAKLNAQSTQTPTQETTQQEQEAEPADALREQAQGGNDGSILLRVYGTPEEQQNILEYISFMGVKCEKL